ncbi:MAG: thiolase family protein, partial [Chloroflexota bacterium]|nr:thiolase family protein [Chloroflexota bacterium]
MTDTLEPLGGRAAIVGVGVTPQAMRGKAPPLTSTELCIDAFKLALDDAGLRKEQIDGLLTEPPMTDPRGTLHYLEVGQALGLNPSFAASLLCGGATAGILIQSAAMAVSSGLATYVACL